MHLYLWAEAELAAEAVVLASDDSYTRCIEMEARGLQDKDDEPDPLVTLAAEKPGRAFRDPKKPKDSIFASHLHGHTAENDPRSTIHIYRTHCGHYGNLLSKMLATLPASGSLIWSGSEKDRTQALP